MLRRMLCGLLLALWTHPGLGQPPNVRIGEEVPRDVREMYEKGMQYLAQSQNQEGNWSGYQNGAGVTGIAMMVFLASGEDPNFGLYSGNIRRAIRSIIEQQDPRTGYYGGSMYHHGFAMLAMAEAYGAVDDRRVWQAGVMPRSIGQSLTLAVRLAITSQEKNPLWAWRYSPDANDADTSVSGAVLVGLLAARNAGIEVPDKNIDRAIAYYVSMTAGSGQVAYSGGIGGFDESLARISIGCLVYSLARRKDLPQFRSTLDYLVEKLESTGDPGGRGWADYQRYYQAQALFQGDFEAWEKWNKLLIRQIKSTQGPDGSISGTQGAPVTTALTLLALAVNYRFLPIYER